MKTFEEDNLEHHWEPPKISKKKKKSKFYGQPPMTLFLGGFNSQNSSKRGKIARLLYIVSQKHIWNTKI
jgi:hypothetical protein